MEGKPLENFETEVRPNLIFQRIPLVVVGSSLQLITLETMRPDWMLLW